MKCRDLIRSLLVFSLVFWAGVSAAEDRNLRLEAPDALWDSGLLKHLLPRFSLKTSIRFDTVEDGGDVRFELDGDGHRSLVLEGDLYTVYLADGADARASRFLDWLKSEVGTRTLLAFNKDGRPEVTLPGKVEAKVVEAAPDGDAVLGERLALLHCGRCHVVSEKNRMGGIGSTPSFSVLRTLPEWRGRFDAFFALNPHPAFTQIPDVTEPFDPMRPPMIAPVELTLDEVAAITAYAATIAEGNLGGALVSK